MGSLPSHYLFLPSICGFDWFVTFHGSVSPYNFSSRFLDFLSKIIPNNALFVLSYLLQTLENLSLNYILKAMIMRVVMPPFAAHFQGRIWWVFTYLNGSSKFGNKWHFTSWMEKQHGWNWQLIHIHIIPMALRQLAESDLSSHGSCTRVLMFVLPMQQSCWSGT